MSSKLTVLGGLVVVIGGVLVLVWLLGSNTLEYQATPQRPGGSVAVSTESVIQTFQCAEGLSVTLTSAVDTTASTLVTPAGESVVMRAQTGMAGERYENLDGNVVWQASDNVWFLEELGLITAAECQLQLPESSTSRPGRHQLSGTSWEWVGVDYTTDESVVPEQPGIFILHFTTNTSMSALTDCNSLRGTYQLGEQRSIKFSDLASTRMFCEESQEEIFQSVLQAATAWRQVNDQLLLILADGTGTSTFVAADVIMQ